MYKYNQNQPFHLVTISPWPFFTAFSILFFIFSFISYIYNFNIFIFNNYIFIIITIINIIININLWFRDIITESTYLGDHTNKVKYNIIIGFYFFIITEIFFFICFFWAFFHSSLNPNIEIGIIWPPKNINIINAFDLPFYNTILLLSSAISITFAHHSFINFNRNNTIFAIGFTFIFAFIFIFCQIFEFYNAKFNFSDGIYGSIFFFITGTHFFHVIIGSVFIFFAFFRIFKYHFYNDHFIGFDIAIIYWHFIDIIWIFVFLFIYWWSP